MRLLTKDDLIETYGKLYQRGLGYFLSKFTFSANSRAKSTFNELDIQSAYAWSLDKVMQRWNEMVTGDPQVLYEEYFVKKYLQNRSGLKMLSLGSGVCSHELRFASYPCFEQVKCVDFSDLVLKGAAETARERNLSNMVFEVHDVNTMDVPSHSFDVILFHASLHHFKNLHLLLAKVKNGLKQDGYMVINDYVGPGRLNLSKPQRKEINRILREELPDAYKKRLSTGAIKNSVSGPGWLRMVISDPSEAVESDRILPLIHEMFEVVEEKVKGGNLIAWVLKDIAHNFDQTKESDHLLKKLFNLEDAFLKKHASDNIFGVYRRID